LKKNPHPVIAIKRKAEIAVSAEDLLRSKAKQDKRTKCKT